jgi:hypothetical protein
MTSPCVCVWSDLVYTFHFLTPTKKMPTHFTINPSEDQPFTFNFIGEYSQFEYTDNTDRFDQVSSWTVDRMDKVNSKVILEDYSYGSTGKVFEIGENFGLLKYKLKCSKIPFKTVPPTVLKKYATGKGNANKELMQERFIKDTGINLKQLLDMTDKQWNPSSDIIDSYYLVRYLRNEVRDEI